MIESLQYTLDNHGDVEAIVLTPSGEYLRVSSVAIELVASTAQLVLRDAFIINAEE